MAGNITEIKADSFGVAITIKVGQYLRVVPDKRFYKVLAIDTAGALMLSTYTMRGGTAKLTEQGNTYQYSVDGFKNAIGRGSVHVQPNPFAPLPKVSKPVVVKQPPPKEKDKEISKPNTSSGVGYSDLFDI